MKPHSLICRLGITDNAMVPLARTDTRVTEISFITGERRLDHGIGQALDHLHSLGFRTSERAVDLALLAALLVQMLDFLTGDRWEVYFRPRPAGLDQLAPTPRQRRVIDPSCVCLFSGGLDSFIGAIDLVSRGETPLLISHYWDGGSSPYQTFCFEHLKKHFTTIPLKHIRARVGFPSDMVGESVPENTMLGRSFLFI